MIFQGHPWSVRRGMGEIGGDKGIGLPEYSGIFAIR
jgi:hypothetical protein